MRLFRTTTKETGKIEDAVEHTLDFYFPSNLPGGATRNSDPEIRLTNGNASINFKATKGADE